MLTVTVQYSGAKLALSGRREGYNDKLICFNFTFWHMEMKTPTLQRLH